MASQITSSRGSGGFVAPSSEPEFSEGYPARGQMGRLTERVTLTAGSAYATLSGKLPARCRVMMTALKTVVAVGLAHSGNSGTSVLCDTYALVNSLPDTTATSATTTMVLAVSATGSTSTAVSGASRTIAAGTADTDAKYFAGEQLTAANAYNASSSEVTLYLVPMDTGGSEDFNIIGATATNGYNFGSAGQIDVTVWYQAYTTLASA